MNKKILVGSIIAVILLLLMPSIPAIQQISVKERFNEKLQEKLETINTFDLNDISLDDEIKFPTLALFVLLIYMVRYLRGFAYSFAFLYILIYIMETNVEFPNLLLTLSIFTTIRGYYLLGTSVIWLLLWTFVSSRLGWNWNFEDITKDLVSS